MNNIKLICNQTSTFRYFKKECISECFLNSFKDTIFNIKLCNGSLIFIPISNDGFFQFEIIESIPEMTPEQLCNYWRIINE